MSIMTANAFVGSWGHRLQQEGQYEWAGNSPFPQQLRRRLEGFEIPVAVMRPVP